jgi:hypothetical protein
LPNKCSTHIQTKELENIKKLYKKTTVYVVRCDTNNKLQDSTPCQNCLHCLIELNIKRIIFSYKDNSFMSCNPNNLKIYHISTGNNYLKKLENQKKINKQ